MADLDLGSGCTGVIAIIAALVIVSFALDVVKGIGGLQVIAFAVAAILLVIGIALLKGAAK